MSDDWAPVIGWSKNTGGKVTNKDTKRAFQKGEAVESDAKQNLGNRKAPAGTLNTKTLDEDFETTKHAVTGKQFGLAMMKARTAKGLTHDTLAQQLGENKAVVAQYESGKAIPNGQIINKMNRVLGVTLPKIQKPKKAKEDL